MILAIDPGVNFLGLSLIKKVDRDDTFSIEVVHTALINNTLKQTDEEKSLSARYGSRAPKIIKIISEIKNYYEQYKFTDIVIEGPFFNAIRPQAYGSLVEVINSIKFSIAINYCIKFHVLEPLLVKKIFSNNHMAKKVDMKSALMQRVNEGLIVLDKDVNTLSEHEIDSIAIGFSFLFAQPQVTIEGE